MAVIASSRVSPCMRAPLSRAIAPSVVLPQRLHYARALHFGPWCSHFTSDHSRHDCRRHRVIRYRYMDTISRKLSWDNGSRSHDAKLAMKRAMAHLMSSKRAPDAKYVNADNVQSWSDDISGLRPGRNIEDAERDAIDHLFRSRSKGSYEYDLWMSPLRNIQNYLSSQHVPKDVSLEDVITATTHHHDTHKSATHSKPKTSSVRHISNRRRHRKSPFASPPHVIHAQAPPASFTPKYEDLDTASTTPNFTATLPSDAEGYGPALWNEPDGLPTPTTEKLSKSYSDLDSYRPTTWKEDKVSSRPSEELTESYPDLDKYKPASWNEPDGLQPKTPEELSKNYDDLAAYNAVEWNEPHGLPAKSPEELSKQYDDLDKYAAVQWNEPDGLPKPTAEELSKQYDDLDKYKPVEWNEPNGLREPTPEEQSKNYSDLETYASPFVAPEETIEAHAAEQLDTTVKAEPLQDRVEVPNTPTNYADLHKYGPVLWNEPDGLRELTPEEKSKKYDDLHLYGAVEWNEPDGLPKPTPEEQSKKYQDLPAYEAISPAEKDLVTSRVHPEEASKKYSDLAKYDYFENDGPVTDRVHPEEASKAYDDLDLYRVTKLDAPDAPYPVHPEEATKSYPDLESYKPVYHNEPDGASNAKPIASNSGLDAFDNGTTTHVPSITHYTSEVDSRNTHYLAEGSRAEDCLTAAQLRARMSQDPTDQVRQRQLDEDMVKYESDWDIASAEAQESVKILRNPSEPHATGNYVRDFPEDFVQTWSTNAASSSLLPNESGAAASTKEDTSRDDFELSSMDESFPMIEKRLEPALDRPTPKRRTSLFSSRDEIADPYSKVPQGLETSYAEECAGTSTWPTVTKHYRSEGADGQSSTPSDCAPESSMLGGTYKVLAYDRTTQSVSVAEMTSSVLDQQPALSPSEVMLKLSNPARFLPHFSSLHAQGYEVVSGSGDVLIFRKVRAADGDAATAGSSQPPVNPIDLMGKPVMGNFASPTGFVNYDSLEADDALKPEPPFRSNIDVRKQEPVFSGSKTEQEHSGQKKKKKKSLGRKIAVGGAWTIGIAYSVGVMAEYFSTGGLDGLGPRAL